VLCPTAPIDIQGLSQISDIIFGVVRDNTLHGGDVILVDTAGFKPDRRFL